MTSPIVFAHGLEGRPDGTKATALRNAGFDVIAPDGRKQSLVQRIAGIEAALEGRSDVVLVGSSYGGKAAVVVAARHPEKLRGLVLAAPALVLREDGVPDPEALRVPAEVPCIAIHGRSDAIIPLAVSERLVARCPHVQLWTVDDDHVLRNTLPKLIEAVRQLSG